jgi:hypothetical protein
MNREILFRGKRLDNGEWVTGHLITDDRDGKEFIVSSIGYHWEEDNGSTNRCMECFGFEVDPETVGQYTGITIKGEKLFEHDQIRFRETETDDWEYGTVAWCGESDYPAFDVEPWIDCDCNGLSYITVDCEVEIVGNKRDNPELLEVLGGE